MVLRLKCSRGLLFEAYRVAWGWTLRGVILRNEVVVKRASQLHILKHPLL